MNIQEAEEFNTSKFYFKTDFNCKNVSVLYRNFVQVRQDAKEMIKDILNKKKCKMNRMSNFRHLLRPYNNPKI